MPIGATCLAHRCGQEQAGLNTNETLFFFSFYPFRTRWRPRVYPYPYHGRACVHGAWHAHSLLVVVSCIVASADRHRPRSRECPASLVQNPFSRTPPEYRPLMRPSYHSTDIIVGFLRVTQIVLLSVGV
jgi:hypothetical protein